jgi:hypothetical protein
MLAEDAAAAGLLLLLFVAEVHLLLGSEVFTGSHYLSGYHSDGSSETGLQDFFLLIKSPYCR